MISSRWLYISLAALLPAACLALLICRYWVNVPFSDEWDLVPIFQFAQAGELRFDYLFSQHNEHRILVPRLLLAALAWLTHGDVRSGMAFTFVLACITSAALAVLLRRTLPDARQWPIWWLLANLLIFSPVQHENWLMGMQMLPIMPVLCLALGLVIAGSTAMIWLKWAACAFLCLLASFSLTNGLVCWLVMLPALWMAGERGRTWLLGLWLALFAAVVAVYFHGYSTPPYHPSLWAAFSHPFAATYYFLTLIGSALSRGTGAPTAAVLGAVLLLGGLGLALYLLKQRTDRALLARVMPWLLLCLYAIASSAMTAAGRFGFGVSQAQDSRYTTVSLYLVLGLLVLAPIAWAHASKSPAAPPMWLRRCVVILAVVCGTIYGISCFRSISSMKSAQLKRLRGMAGIALCDIANTDDSLELLYPRPRDILGRIRFLDALGCLHPGILKKEDVVLTGPADARFGSLESLSQNTDGTWLAKGWAAGDNGSADAVILAAAGAAGHPLPFRVARTGVRVAKSQPRAYGWQAIIAADELPVGEISAWSFDVRSASVHRMP